MRLALAALPAERGQDGRDAALFRCTKAFDVVELKRRLRHLQHGGSLYTDQILGDWFFPCVTLVSLILFGLGMLALEVPVRPPPHPTAVAFDGFGKQLIAVVDQPLNVNRADLHWPEAAATGLVAQVVVLVGGADEDTLARLDDLLAAIAMDGSVRLCG